ncbi:MAG: hypothetical protein N2749_00290 [Clostridia bacterium]|nr:hypothetical protein [Clostridia bacterium]
MNILKKYIIRNNTIYTIDKKIKKSNKDQKVSNLSYIPTIIIVLLIFGSLGSSFYYYSKKNIDNNLASNIKNNIVVHTDTNTSYNLNTKIDLKPNIETNSSVNLSPEQDKSTNEYVGNLDEKNYTVYITKTGSKYHKSGCRYLRQSRISTTLNLAISEGYDACSVCNP